MPGPRRPVIVAAMPASGNNAPRIVAPHTDGEVTRLFNAVADRSPAKAARLLEPQPNETIGAVIERLNPGRRLAVLDCFDAQRCQAILAAANPEDREEWTQNRNFSEQSVGRLMAPARAVFRPDATIGDVVETLRDLVKKAFITYVFVTDDEGRLVGVVAMRELLLGSPRQPLSEVMIPSPFYLTPELPLTTAMKAVLSRHYPVYPVCDEAGRLLGVVRGQTMFEAQAVELSAQPGVIVGVEKEERLYTPWTRSLRLRHPWLQVNLFTGFLAAVVVGYFQGTINRLVLLAVFLPVLMSQASNTGMQTLAVSLRGLTLGELRAGRESLFVCKETFLGLLNGALTGLTAGACMFVVAVAQKNADAFMLGLVVFLAMTGSCVISGVFGALVPLVLRRFGTDPANAAGIVLTTVTDVVSMAVFLGLASVLI